MSAETLKLRRAIKGESLDDWITRQRKIDKMQARPYMYVEPKNQYSLDKYNEGIPWEQDEPMSPKESEIKYRFYTEGDDPKDQRPNVGWNY